MMASAYSSSGRGRKESENTLSSGNLQQPAFSHDKQRKSLSKKANITSKSF